jgi:hypothetical protein
MGNIVARAVTSNRLALLNVGIFMPLEKIVPLQEFK